MNREPTTAHVCRGFRYILGTSCVNTFEKIYSDPSLARESNYDTMVEVDPIRFSLIEFGVFASYVRIK